MKDAVGKSIPAWARYIKSVTSLVEQTEAQGAIVPFALYLPDDTTVEFTPIDNAASISVTLGAGYHPIACKSLTSASSAVLALFAWNYEA